MNSPVKAATYGEALKKILTEEGRVNLFPGNLLEKYPHIVDQIYLLWSEPEKAHHYFVGLLTTQRENRAGFPLDVYTELFALENYYTKTRPNAQKSDDFWTGVKQVD